MIGTTIQKSNSQLPGGLITTEQIADGAVTLEKLSDEVLARLSAPVDFDNFKIVAAREAFPLNPQVGYYLLARTDGRAIAKVYKDMFPYVIPNFDPNKFYNIPHIDGVINSGSPNTAIGDGRILYEFDTDAPHDYKRNQVLRYLYYWDGTSWIDHSELLPRIRKIVYLTTDNIFFDKYRSYLAPFAYFKRVYHFKEIDFNDVVLNPSKYIIYEINYVWSRDFITREKKAYELRSTFVYNQKDPTYSFYRIVSGRKRLRRGNRSGDKVAKIGFVVFKRGIVAHERILSKNLKSKIYKRLNVNLFFSGALWNGRYI